MPSEFKQLKQKSELEVLCFRMDALSTESLSLETWVAFKSLNIKPEWFRVKLEGQENEFLSENLALHQRHTSLPFNSVSNYVRVGCTMIVHDC